MDEVHADTSKAEIMYIFPTELKPIFKFFWKSRNLKSFIMSLKSHSIEERTALFELIHLLSKNHISEGSLEMDSQWERWIFVRAQRVPSQVERVPS